MKQNRQVMNHAAILLGFVAFIVILAGLSAWLFDLGRIRAGTAIVGLCILFIVKSGKTVISHGKLLLVDDFGLKFLASKVFWIKATAGLAAVVIISLLVMHFKHTKALDRFEDTWLGHRQKLLKIEELFKTRISTGMDLKLPEQMEFVGGGGDQDISNTQIYVTQSSYGLDSKKRYNLASDLYSNYGLDEPKSDEYYTDPVLRTQAPRKFKSEFGPDWFVDNCKKVRYIVAVHAPAIREIPDYDFESFPIDVLLYDLASDVILHQTQLKVSYYKKTAAQSVKGAVLEYMENVLKIKVFMRSKVFN